jgi:hypothetical protein
MRHCRHRAAAVAAAKSTRTMPIDRPSGFAAIRKSEPAPRFRGQQGLRDDSATAASLDSDEMENSMQTKVLVGALLAGIIATVPAFAQTATPSQATPPAAPATAAAAPAMSGSGAAESPPRKGSEGAKSDEKRALSLLTYEERKEHRAKMAHFKTVAECKSYIDAFWQDIEKRAKEKNVAGPFVGPRTETCDQMQARGQIK